MLLRVTSTGNAGVFLENAQGRLYVDSFFRGVPGVGSAPILPGGKAQEADLILITHAHYDHLHPEEVRDAALASGAKVAGPVEVIRLLKKFLPADRLILLESPERKKPPSSASVAVGNIFITSFRTYHMRGHNSYLIEMGGVRILHDADNERTQPFDLGLLGRIDVLFLCPWAGSGAGTFVQTLNPGKWFLIHMTDEEIEQHRAGSFLPGLVSPVPEGVIALCGGESLEI
ncbi:MAG: MBL fold metallo-hydrolase [Planctomycetes bacterium]|nr:MBL fold metallo-hydrolase [Planctomycetota bacterium]